MLVVSSVAAGMEPRLRHDNDCSVREPFDDWMKVNHPDEVAAIRFGNWTTTEEAERGGTVIAEYSTEWATYLEANGCEFDDGC